MKRFDNKTAGILARTDLKTLKGRLIYWTFFALLTIMSIIALFPTIWTILTAFKTTEEIYSGFTLFPKDMSPSTMLNRIREAWNSLQLGTSFINTIVLSLGNLVSTILICGLAGYVLSKLKPRGSRIVFTLIVWTMMMPTQMCLVPNYVTMLHFPFAYDFGAGINLLDSYWPLWIEAASSAFTVILFKNSFDGLSQSYVEAAKIDGCTNLGIFFRIMLPLSMPVIIYVSIGVLSGAWSNFFGPLLYFNKISVVPLKVYKMQSDAGIRMNTRFMGFVFASLPPFLIFAFFQKRIMGGINIGGVKG